MGNIRKWLALAGLFCVLPLAQANAGECQLKLIASLDMTPGPSGGATVPLVLDGKPRQFLVDTGGYLTSITDTVVNELKLEPMESEVKAYSASGKTYDQTTVLPSLGIGPLAAHHVEVMVLPAEIGPGKIIAGTLAPDLLRNFDVELDFAKKKMNLFSPDHCKGQVVYWSHSYAAIPMKLSNEGHIVVRANLDGHDLDAIIDTGVARSIANFLLFKELFDIDPSSPGVEKTNGYAGSAYQKVFKNLDFNGLSVRNPKLVLLPDAIYNNARWDTPDRERYIPGRIPHLADLVLGLDVIDQVHMYIAYGERMLYITAADAH